VIGGDLRLAQIYEAAEKAIPSTVLAPLAFIHDNGA